MNNEKKGLIAVILGNSIFGFSFLFSRLALDVAVPSVLIACRFSVAFILLNLIVIIGGRIKNNDGKALVEFSLKGKPKKNILLLALFQPITYFIAENYGILYTSSSFAGIIIALIPLVGIMFDLIFFGQRITMKQSVCAVLSVVGVFFTTIGAQEMSSSSKGVILLLVAVVAGAMFYVFSSKAASDYSPLERTYVMFGLGSAFYIIFALAQCFGSYKAMLLVPLTTPIFWISIAYLSGVSSVVAFLLLNYGSEKISVSRATMLANLTTVISIVAGVVVLHEKFTISQVIGAIIILASVYLATAKNNN